MNDEQDSFKENAIALPTVDNKSKDSIMKILGAIAGTIGIFLPAFVLVWVVNP
nr:hypothetical protein [Stanieria cyanosphaera]